MRVHCPNCATAYEIPSLVRPRRLRCAQCAGEWREAGAPGAASADAPDERPAVVEAPDPAPAEATARQDPDAPELLPHLPAAPEAEEGLPPGPAPGGAPGLSPAVRAGARLGSGGILLWTLLWVLSLAVIAAGLASLWHWRVAIVQDWPPMLRLYRLLPGWPAT